VDVTDDWTAIAFSELFRNVDAAYRGLSNFEHLYAHVFNNETLNPLPPVPPPLMMGTVRISSPGIAEVVGSLNPLKVIADFITNYRAENTKRMNFATESETRKEEIRMNFAIEVLKLSGPQQSEKVKRLADGLALKVLSHLEPLVNESKLEQINVIEVIE